MTQNFHQSYITVWRHVKIWYWRIFAFDSLIASKMCSLYKIQLFGNINKQQNFYSLYLKHTNIYDVSSKGPSFGITVCRESKLLYIGSLSVTVTTNAMQGLTLHCKAVKCKWFVVFKTSIFSYSFDMRKKIWNELVKQKFFHVISAQMFAVDGGREAWTLL
jgi:hypothetical protein